MLQRTALQKAGRIVIKLDPSLIILFRELRRNEMKRNFVVKSCLLITFLCNSLSFLLLFGVCLFDYR